MATSIFELFGTIMVDNKDANKSLSETDSKAGKLAKTFVGGAKKVAAFGAAAVGAATAGVGAVTKMASSAAGAMDEIDKASQKMGISTQAYQEWDHVMQLSGMDISTMKNGLKTLSIAMTGVSEEGEETTAEFEKLGVSVKDANGNLRPTEEVMNDVIAALADMEEGAERTAISTKLFGRAGVEMAPMLNSGSDAIAAMKQEAHDLGLVFSDEAVKSGAQLNDTMGNVKASFEAAKTSLGVSLMPVVQKFAELLLQYIPKISEIFNKLSPILISLFERLMPPLMDVVDAVLPVIFDLLDALMPIFMDLIDMVLPIVVDMLNLISPLLKLVSELLQPILDLVNLLLKPILDFVHWIFGGIVDGLTDVTDGLDGEGGLLGGLGSVSDFIFGDFSEAFDLLGGVIGEAVSLIGDAFKGIINFLRDPKQALSDFFDWASNKISTVWESLKTIATGVGDLIDAKEAEEKAHQNYATVHAAYEANADKIVKYNGSTYSFASKADANAFRREHGIPELAEGAVLEPNKPFMAIVGDQKHGTNVEAPLDTIKQAVAEVIGSLQVNVLCNIQNDMDRTYSIMQERSWIEYNRTNVKQFG